MKRSRGSLPRSFGYALRGIAGALTRERNLRVHFAAGAFVLFFSRYYSFTRGELAALILTVGFVIAAELANTAVEKTVDLVTSEIHPLARIAKDAAAGAVLISAATSVAVGVLLFWDLAVLRRIALDIAARPAISIIVLAVSVVWIVFPKQKKRHSPASGGRMSDKS